MPVMEAEIFFHGTIFAAFSPFVDPDTRQLIASVDLFVQTADTDAAIDNRVGGVSEITFEDC
jgi:hypothetical protein